MKMVENFLTNILGTPVLLLVVLLLLLYFHLKRCFTYWERRGVFAPKPEFLFGHVKLLILQKESVACAFQRIYDECQKKSMPFGGFYFFTKPILVVTDLDLIGRVMASDFQYFTDRVMRPNEYEPISMNLGNLQGLKWKEARKRVSPAFSPAKLKTMFSTVEDCTDRLVATIDDLITKNYCVELKKLLNRYAAHVIVFSAFGVKTDTLTNSNCQFLKCAKKYFSASVKDSLVRLMAYLFPNILSLFKVKTVNEDTAKLFLNTIAEIVKYREDNNIVRNDILQSLLQVRNNIKLEENVNNANDVKYLSLSDIAAQCFVFLVAGFESTSSTPTFCLYELACTPQYQEQARDEVNTVLAEHNGEFTFDALLKMYYLEKCIRETLRKYPTVPVHMRECTKTYTIPETNVVIEKGTAVIIPALSFQRDPKIFSDPDVFDPERFSEENIAQRHPCAWTPFGFGPRMCIASQMGMMSTKLTLAKILKNYSFVLHSSTKVPLEMNPKTFFTESSDGIRLNVEKITP